MAINVKKMLAESLLKLCEKQTLEDITIQMMLDDTGISRQTFYNHFKDKNDLIQYIYQTRIIPQFDHEKEMKDFEVSLKESFDHMKQYRHFMKQACLLEGQNCLKDYMFDHCEKYDLMWHQACFGDEKMPDALYFATIYHANASSSMTLSWILSDMPVSTLELARMITQMRAIGMDVLFKNGKKNPYRQN